MTIVLDLSHGDTDAKIDNAIAQLMDIAQPKTGSDFPQGTRVIVPSYYTDPDNLGHMKTVYRDHGTVTHGTAGAEWRHPNMVWVKLDAGGGIFPDAFDPTTLRFEDET